MYISEHGYVPILHGRAHQIIKMKTLIDIDLNLLFFFNGSQSLFVDNLAVALTSGFTWIPLYVILFYIVVKNNETMKQVMLTVGGVLLCLILTDGAADFIVKPMVERLRPSQAPVIKYMVDTVNGLCESQYGFFSAHAANTFGVAVFFSLLIRSRKFTAAIMLWSVVNCWTRMYLGVHYPGDIIVGLLYGAVVGVIVYYIYLKVYFKISPKFNYISSQYTTTGYNLSDVDTILVVLVLTLIYTILRALVFIC